MSGTNLIRYGFKTSRLLKLVHRNTRIMAVRSCGWVRDYKPGPYPRTPEEREAAARKYNLIPEDYEPNEDGSGYGDYPNLPVLGQDAADPYEDYDYYYRRRNYAQTLHVDYDMHVSERTNPNAVYRYSTWYMVGFIMAPFVFLIFVKWLDYHYDLHTANPMKPKQFPNDGKPHYTFEPLD